MTTDNPAPPKRRPRISLLSLLLLTSTLAFAITAFLLWRSVEPLRQEVRMLRAETGRLSVRDVSKLQAIQVALGRDREWKWRVRVPPGAAYFVDARGNDLPGEGFPTLGGGSGPIREGTYVVEHVIEQSAATGERVGHYSVKRVDGDSPGIVLTGETGGHDWLSWGGYTAMMGGVGFDTEAYETGEPIVIARWRVGKESVGSGAEDLRPGFMIWLEPAP